MCGLFGYIGKKQKFNSLAFNLLGVCNDTRGGDSCGIFIDGKSDFGHDKTKLYNNFYQQSELLKSIDKAAIALGHCRKASVGGISLETVQPVIITKEDDESIVDFVLIHNGTINNYKDLAKKYLKLEKDKEYTDSYILAYIFYYHGFEVLKEYVGAAVFVMVDYREDRENPKCYLFKGKSPQNYNGTPTEERPLYIASNKKVIWFCSIENALKLVANENNVSVRDLPCNTLFCIQNGKIISKTVYDREAIEWKSQYSYNYPTLFDKPAAKYPGLNFSEYNNYGTNSYQKDGTAVSRILEEPPCYNNVNRVSFKPSKYRYFLNETLAHGEILVSKAGWLSKELSAYSMTVYFFQGVLLRSKKALQFLVDLCDELNISAEELMIHYEPIVWSMSVYPYYDVDFNSFTKIYLSNAIDAFRIISSTFNGPIPIIFLSTDKVYNVKNGFITSYNTKYTNNEFIENYIKHSNDDFDYKKILKNVKNTLKQLNNA